MTPDLDALLVVPTVEATLRKALGLEPTGVGAVCFTAAECDASVRPPAQSDLLAMVGTDVSADVSARTDEFGFSWIAARQPVADLPALVQLLHRITTSLVDAGLGPCLQYTSIGFGAEGERRLALVHLLGHATFYPFAPQRVPLRDNALELRVRDELDPVLPIEPDLSRWFPTWNAPVP